MDANALERETLERKDRDELQKIVGALGGKATTRTRKADLIDQILELTGVTTAGAGADADADDRATSEGGSGSPAPSEDAPSEDASAPGGSEDDGPSKGGDGRSGASGKADAGRADGGRQQGGRQQGGDAKAQQGGDAKAQQGGDGKAQQGGDAKNDQGGDDDEAGGRRRRRRGRNRDAGAQEEYTGDPIPVEGILDLRDDGYGFLRVEGLLPSKDDCYVSVKQVRQFGLRKGDRIAGGSRPALRNEKNPAILRIDTVNGVELEPGADRPRIQELGATFPTERIAVAVTAEEEADRHDDALATAIDVLAPIGKGSRVLVQAPPRSGATTLLQTVARGVELNEPDAHLVVVLLDERPEEITEMRDLVAGGDVYGSPVDGDADEHVATVELAVARAQRLAEVGEDVVLLVDGLARLARAAHMATNGVGRTLGGLDVAAVQTAKRVFAAGRDLVEGGSITLVAVTEVDTLSEAAEAVLDVVRGAATTTIRLEGFAAARRAFPAIDVAGTGTRREELLVGEDGAEAREALRRALAELPEGDTADNDVQLDALLARLREAGTEDELLAEVTKG